MSRLAFYPGCALESMSWDYRESIKRTVGALDLELVEVEDWTCCGASAAHSFGEHMAVALPARNLANLGALDLDLAVACPMCFKRLNHARHALREQKVDEPCSIRPDLEVVDLARVLTSEPMLERVKEQVQVPLTGLRAVCYYGCQVVRHPSITGYGDYENPQHLDRFVEALGATAIDWSFKAICCGASLGIPKKEIGLSLVKRLLSQAHASGAQAIVVCCPLCQSNLDLYQPQICEQDGRELAEGGIPILYYTELLGIALGLKSIRKCLKGHLVNPLPLLDRVLGQ